MTVIGIDPGIERTGIGIIEEKNNKLFLIYNKLIKTSPKDTQSQRLYHLYNELDKIINSYKIDFASVEKIFFTKNIKTAMNVSEARGVILLVLGKNSIPVYEYTPLQVKQSLVGYGNASKNQIQQFVKIMLNLKDLPKQDDIADGIALAIIHINTYKTLSKIRKDTN